MTRPTFRIAIETDFLNSGFVEFRYPNNSKLEAEASEQFRVPARKSHVAWDKLACAHLLIVKFWRLGGSWCLFESAWGIDDYFDDNDQGDVSLTS